ncbi:ribosome small subunit-dependent GTPase A [Niabella drilacis]|uniref:Small ribosomal subunit biogenesis GTPase RsgA n=1 Tax=Niabella drilacis (strain DSM 25811 / CCM 8410 / CCUG 62505 / LMG 26954 / E90) TaxID=1285928 RepID=A0A1G6NLY6_NIADE|nr:ribosome small subunit-dependent GTPase A [Niabella drilacis]SDC68749.1 ribosome biogenesis GTPase [Niabella drilacis]
MKALVYKSTGSWYTVKDETGKFHNARIKGVFKIDGITSTNPLAVGDWVNIEAEDGAEGSAMIDEIFPRSNYINRQSPRVKYQQHIIAANLDQSILIATLKEPRTSRGFIDRFLVVCEMYHVPAILLFNKTDIYREKEWAAYEALSAVYQSLGYQVYAVSVEKQSGLEALGSLLQDKTTLISGHSGVGKSSLINMLLPKEGIKTQDVSGWSGKGMHTTTFATMYDLPEGGRIIDTPGIRELAITNLEREELSHYFPEMRERLDQCRYNNCTHINEPGCAVKAAVESGMIYEERYISYLNIFESMGKKDY